jgi:hypothetical protein
MKSARAINRTIQCAGLLVQAITINRLPLSRGEYKMYRRVQFPGGYFLKKKSGALTGAPFFIGIYFV